MKRRPLRLITVLSASIFLLCLFSVAMAGTIGNPTARLEQGVFQVGGEIDFTERDMKHDLEGHDSDDFEVESNRYIVTGAYGVSEQVNVHAKLGMADAEIGNIDGDMQITYGGGLRATVHEVDDFKIGIAAQISYFSSKDTLPEETEVSYDYSITYSGDIELTWWEYEIAVGASYKGIEGFLPYGGILFSKVSGECEINGKREKEYHNPSDGSPSSGSKSENGDVDEDDLVGIFFGANYDVTPEFTVGVEARLMNQNSFSFMANYVF